MAALAHDHVVTIYHVGEDRGVPFLAMQYLDGETLDARLQHAGPLPQADIVHIARQLAEGLAAAHAHGLLHRDIKPANVWLESPLSVVSSQLAQSGRIDNRQQTTGNFRVKILDFGLAWAADGEGPLTEFGMVVGTPAFMSPEQARGETADVRSDLFSLGSVLYAMCTGQPPFQQGSTFATLEKVRTESPRPILEINPELPDWLAQVVTKLHAKDPAQRFQSAAEVATLLRSQKSPVATKLESVPCAATPINRRKSLWRWWTTAAAILLFSLVGLGICEATGVTQLSSVFLEQRADSGHGDESPTLLNTGTPEPVHDPSQIKPVAAAAQPEEKAPAVLPAALFTFEERGPGVRDLGPKVTDILFAKLSARPEVLLVDRSDMKKTLAELELNISGVVKAGDATKIGQMTGAKLFISGSVIQADKRTFLVAKIVGTETSRVLGVAVDGKSSDELVPLVEKLAEQIADKIGKEGDKIVAKSVKPVDRIAELNKKLKGVLPSVMVKITERHVGGVRIDPAAETEVSKICKETGFTLFDPEEGLKSKADVFIVGEAISETATRNGNLVSVKARVEIKAIDRQSGKILAVDRQTALVVDLAENIAGKAALAEAAGILAERILPRIVK